MPKKLPGVKDARNWEPVLHAALDKDKKPCGPTSDDDKKRNVKGSFKTETEAAFVADIAKIWHNMKTSARHQVASSVLQDFLNFRFE